MSLEVGPHAHQVHDSVFSPNQRDGFRLAADDDSFDTGSIVRNSIVADNAGGSIRAPGRASLIIDNVIEDNRWGLSLGSLADWNGPYRGNSTRIPRA